VRAAKDVKKKNGQFILVTDGKEDEEITNFFYYIKSDITKKFPDGTEIHMYTIRGKNKNGDHLSELIIPAQEFESGNWVLAWGSGAVVYNKAIFNNQVRIKMLSKKNIKLEEQHEYVGFFKKNDGTLAYVSKAGCITSGRYDKSIKSCLIGKFAHYSLPAPTSRPAKLKKCIRSVLDLVTLAPNNPDIGIFCCTTPIRAILNMCIPITASHFVVGETGLKKSALVCLPQAFFGKGFYQQTQLPAEWEDTESSLEDMSIFIRDSVLVIDDFIPTKRNAKELGSKAERVFRGAANRTARQRSNSSGNLQHKASPGAMIAATGESLSLPLNGSLLKRIIFFLIEEGDLDLDVLTEYQALAEKGVLAQFTSSLIQFLLNNSNDLEEKIESKFKKYRDKSKKELPGKVHSRVHENVASLMISLQVLYFFAKCKNVISTGEYDRKLETSWEQVIQLAKKQSLITDRSSLSNLLFKYLKKGLSNGEVYLGDYSTGSRPKIKNSDRLGWKKQSPQGVCIGWYDRKTKSVYIQSSEEIFNIVFNLIPEGLKKQIPSQRKKFWKDMESTGGLSSTESGRNTTRKTDPETKESVLVYPLSPDFNF